MSPLFKSWDQWEITRCVCVCVCVCGCSSAVCVVTRVDTVNPLCFDTLCFSEQYVPSKTGWTTHSLLYMSTEIRDIVCVCVSAHVCSLVFLPSSTVHFVFLTAFISSHSWHTDSLSLWLRTLEDIVFCTAHYPQTCRSRTHIHTHTHTHHFLCRL